MKGNNATNTNYFGSVIILSGLYICWWGYVIFFLYWQEYDNNYAAGTALIGLGVATCLIVVIYIIGFAVAYKDDKKIRKWFLFFISLLLAPIISVFLFEILK